MEIIRGIVIGLMLLGVIFIIRSIYNSDENKEKREEYRKEHMAKIEDYERRVKESKMIGNIKCKVLGSVFGSSLVFTNDSRLYIVNRANLILIPINFENILDVQLEYKILEKNKMKLISIRPTFDKHTKFESCTLKLMLEDETISFYYSPDYLSNGCLEKEPIRQNKLEAIDSMERMKLLIERELKRRNS